MFGNGTMENVEMRKAIEISNVDRKHGVAKAKYKIKIDACEEKHKHHANQEVSLKSEYGTKDQNGTKQLPTLIRAYLTLLGGLVCLAGAIFIAYGEYALTFLALSIYSIPPNILDIISWVITLSVAGTGEMFISTHFEEMWFREKSYFLYRIFQRASEVALFCALLLQAVVAGIRGVTFASNILMKFRKSSPLYFLMQSVKILMPGVFILLALIISTIMVFFFHIGLTYTKDGLALVMHYFSIARNARRKNHLLIKSASLDKWREHKILSIEKKASMKRATLLEKQKEDEAKRISRKEKHDAWHIDPKKNEGHQKQLPLSEIGGVILIPLMLTSLNCSLQRDQPQTSVSTRQPLDIVGIIDLSGSQELEREDNKLVLSSVAENLYLGDHFRIIPIDQSSEGHNETLLDVSIPVERGTLDFDLLGARNEAVETVDSIYRVSAHRTEFTGGTSIIGALNTVAVSDATYQNYRRIVLILSDLEENSWEASFYKKFNPEQMIDRLEAEGRIPDLSDREIWVVGASDAHVSPEHLRFIKSFWESFAAKAGCNRFRWYGWDRKLLTKNLNRVLSEGQQHELYGP